MRTIKENLLITIIMYNDTRNCILILIILIQ